MRTGRMGGRSMLYAFPIAGSCRAHDFFVDKSRKIRYIMRSFRKKLCKVQIFQVVSDIEGRIEHFA